MRDTRRTRVILALLLVTSLTLVAVDLRGNADGGLRGLAASIFGPLERAATAVVSPVRGVVERVSGGGPDQAEVDALRAENERLLAENRTSDLARNRAAELDALLRVAGAGQYRTVPARVVAIGPAQGFAWTVTIDAGRRDGIKPDMTVINGDGLVGRVLDVGPSTATVVLITDSTISLGARIENSMQVGIVNGTGEPGSLQLQLLDTLADVRVGQRLVSFGVSGGVYVAGVPIGEVTSVSGTPGQLSRVAAVTPYVDVSSLDLVGVVIEKPRTDPRDSVLPPGPSPRPVPTVTVTVTATPTPTPTDGAVP